MLVRYVREDGKLHSVNLQVPGASDGRTHSVILRLGGLGSQRLLLELHVNCRLADSSQGLPPLVTMPADTTTVDVRTGHKTYARLQVRTHDCACVCVRK